MVGLSYTLLGKILETIGATLLAYVAVKAACVEWTVGRHLRSDGMSKNEDLESIRIALSEIAERRRRQFGPTEALLVGIGTTLVAIGCLVYLLGLNQPH